MVRALALNGLVVALALGATALAPAPGGAVAVATWPGGTRAGALDAVAAADGAFLALVRPWLALAASDRPDFALRLYRAGAVLVVGAGGAGLCRTAINPMERS